MATTQIPGYKYGSQDLPRSPVSETDLRLLQASVLFSEEDGKLLRRAGEILENQIEEVLDLWYGFVGSQPHLVEHFRGLAGGPDPKYLAAVRRRFGQWIRDTCRANYDQTWLDYQDEIGLRHSDIKKNRTDNIQGSTPHVPLRYLIALIYPITATIKPFLAKGGDSSEQVDKMHQAWFKSVVLQVALWSRAYAREGLF